MGWSSISRCSSRGVAVKVTSRGPVLFRQERVGQHGRPFTMLKFRTMVVGAEDMLEGLRALNEADGPLFKISDDPRVTRCRPLAAQVEPGRAAAAAERDRAAT